MFLKNCFNMKKKKMFFSNLFIIVIPASIKWNVLECIWKTLTFLLFNLLLKENFKSKKHYIYNVKDEEKGFAKPKNLISKIEILQDILKIIIFVNSIKKNVCIMNYQLYFDSKTICKKFKNIIKCSILNIEWIDIKNHIYKWNCKNNHTQIFPNAVKMGIKLQNLVYHLVKEPRNFFLVSLQKINRGGYV